MTEFQQNSCVVVRNFIDPDTTKAMSYYMEHKFRSNQWHVRAEGTSMELEPSALECYADPFVEYVLQESIPAMEDITGLELYPTYSFSRIYIKGDELTRHVDRPACEVSVTVNVARVGNNWPIWMQVPGSGPIKVELDPGDAVVYKGCEVSHWREKMLQTDINVQFMLHYVNKNGPNAKHKWDTRPGLGYPVTSKKEHVKCQLEPLK